MIFIDRVDVIHINIFIICYTAVNLKGLIAYWVWKEYKQENDAKNWYHQIEMMQIFVRQCDKEISEST